MSRVRVLVVEDSLTVRKHLCEVLARDPAIELVGEAENGKRALELCRELRPDVVTMDMMLPEMSGLAATELIMAYCPTPILVVSSSLERGELFKTYEALAAGAVDVLEKPQGGAADHDWEARFVSAVKLVARIRVISHPRARLRDYAQSRADAAAPPQDRVPRSRVIGIGASTGGPAAVVRILRDLPAALPVPMLLVIHISEPFGAAFAEWLDGQSPLRVAYARDGEPLASAVGRVVMAPPRRHLVVRGSRLHLTEDPERHSCRPSVDVLFESMAQDLGPSAVGCLLTGMGRDGAAGLLGIRRGGGLTVAQDEATSVVYGMPREAVALGAVDEVLPLPQIAPRLAALAAGGGSRR